VDESISLARVASTKEGGNDFSESAPSLPPFLRVERTLRLGLKWEVETTVTRETGAGTPLVIEIPLLPGESVTTADIRTEKMRAAVSLSLAPGEASATWKSTLAESRAIALRVEPKTASRWSEIWRAEVSPIWHATFSGIPPVRRDPASSTRTPEWRPWPGEEVHIAIDKPGGVTGRTLTIDASTLNLEPGLRGTQLGLVLEVRSSRGTEHTIALPTGAEVTSTSRDNVSQPIRRQGQELILGRGWHDHDDLVFAPSTGLVNQPPVVNLGANQTITWPAAASLNGTVTDAGLPSPPGTVTSPTPRSHSGGSQAAD